MAIEIPLVSSIAKFCYAMATFSATVEKQNTLIQAQSKEMGKMKENYLGKFQDVKDRINTSERTILEKMNENHIEIIDRINSKKK